MAREIACRPLMMLLTDWRDTPVALLTATWSRPRRRNSARRCAPGEARMLVVSGSVLPRLPAAML